jgi:hypothetical protein
MSDSVFLEFAETDLLRRGSLDCREEEEMEEMGDSMGRQAVELLREAGSCAPCPSGKEGVSAKPETWRTREGVAEPAAGGSESAVAVAVAGRAAAAAVEAAPVAGASPPAGSTTSLAATTAPAAESPPGNEGGEDDGVEAAPMAGAAPPSGDDDFPSGDNSPSGRVAAGQ